MNISVIHSVLPDSDAVAARHILDHAEWKHENYSDSAYYGKMYQNPKTGIPNAEEVYTTNFYKWHSIYSSGIMLEIMVRLLDVIDSKLGTKHVRRDQVSLLGYRLGPGGHLRLHNDNYAADIGFVWYLSKDWKWDWGGLLLSVNDDGTASIEMPEYNKLVLIDHSKTVTHCVTSVESWAGDDRVFIVGMLRLV